ncbi:hypothetical protein ACHAW6_004078 [Cyclotella cf. meneghiniana]
MLTADKMFINNIPFLLTRSRDIQLNTIEVLHRMTSETNLSAYYKSMYKQPTWIRSLTQLLQHAPSSLLTQWWLMSTSPKLSAMYDLSKNAHKV